MKAAPIVDAAADVGAAETTATAEIDVKARLPTRSNGWHLFYSRNHKPAAFSLPVFLVAYIERNLFRLLLSHVAVGNGMNSVLQSGFHLAAAR